jgi:hypothetical protein
VPTCGDSQRVEDHCCVNCAGAFAERCGTKTVGDTKSEEIITCKSGYYLQNGVCVQKCIPGSFEDDILGWCIKCSCDCERCSGYKNGCIDSCSSGSFNSNTQRCEFYLEADPVVSVDANTATISIEFPPGVSVLNVTETDIARDSLYNMNGICRDEAYESDWTEYLNNNYDYTNIIASLKSMLNEDEKSQIDRILSADYSAIDSSLQESNSYAKYMMEEEGTFEIVKLLAYYRYSLFGKTNLASQYGYVDKNFYHESSMVLNACKLLLDIDTILSLNYPECIFTTDGSNKLKISITVDDLTIVDPSIQISFNDVLYFRNSTVTLPLSEVYVAIPLMNKEVEMNPEVILPYMINSCEDLYIDFSKSVGLSYNFNITVHLDALQDATTSNFVNDGFLTIQRNFNAAMVPLVNQMIVNKSKVLLIKSDFLTSFVDKRLYLSFIFRNMVTGDTQIEHNYIEITSKTRVEVLEQSLIINRGMATIIDVFEVISCNSTENSNPEVTCHGKVIHVSTLGIASASDIIFEDCIIYPTQVDVDSINDIWVEVTINDGTQIVPIVFEVEEINCYCNLEGVKAAYGTTETFTVSSINCPAEYTLSWKFTNEANNAVHEFTTSNGSFIISDYLSASTKYQLMLSIMDEDNVLTYGQCKHVIEILAGTQSLDTRINDLSTGGLQDRMVLQIVTFDSSGEINALVTSLTLIEEGTSTNLLESTFSSSFHLSSNNKLIFKAGIWTEGKVYILTAVTTLNGVSGKAVKIINVKKLDYFSVGISPKVVTTGDQIKVTITKKSDAKCLRCAIGFHDGTNFKPYKILTKPEKICQDDLSVKTTLRMPLMSAKNSVNAELAVLCINDDKSKNDEENVQMKRFKIQITNQQLTADLLTIGGEPLNSERMDELCLGILSLPSSLCPPEGFDEICIEAIGNKFKYIVKHSGILEKLWMKLNNMLIYAFTRTVTCGEGSFTDDQYQIVTIILDGLCNSFAEDNSLCSEIDPSTITCNVFDEDYVNLILRIIKDIQDKMAVNTKFTDLEAKMDVVKRLIECSSTNYITDGNGNEVHSTSGSIAVIKVGTLTQNYKAQLAHSSSSNRRNLATASNICSVQFDQIPTNLQSEGNLVIKMEYDTSCASNNKVCGSADILTTTPKCCKISVVSASTDFSGATKIVRKDVTSNENGSASLVVPSSSCTSDSKCIYLDETNKCWSTTGVTTNSNCAGCVTNHFSIFSMSSISSSGKIS